MSREQKAVERARKAFETGRSKPLEYRIEQLKNLQRLFNERQREIADAIKKDLNKVKCPCCLHTLTLENWKNVSQCHSDGQNANAYSERGCQEWWQLEMFSSASSERGRSTVLWNFRVGRGDRPRHQETERVGCTSARGKEPADHLRHRLHPAGAAGSGAHHRGLELPVGRHHPAARRSHRCRYGWTAVCLEQAHQYVFKGDEVSVHILVATRHPNTSRWTLRAVLWLWPKYFLFHPGITQHWAPPLLWSGINVSKAVLWAANRGLYSRRKELAESSACVFLCTFTWTSVPSWYKVGVTWDGAAVKMFTGPCRKVWCRLSWLAAVRDDLFALPGL